MPFGQIAASSDLVTWQEDVGVFVDETIHEDVTVTQIWREVEPMSSLETRFLRLSVLGESPEREKGQEFLVAKAVAAGGALVILFCHATILAASR